MSNPSDPSHVLRLLARELTLMVWEMPKLDWLQGDRCIEEAMKGGPEAGEPATLRDTLLAEFIPGALRGRDAEIEMETVA